MAESLAEHLAKLSNVKREWQRSTLRRAWEAMRDECQNRVVHLSASENDYHDCVHGMVVGKKPLGAKDFCAFSTCPLVRELREELER